MKDVRDRLLKMPLFKGCSDYDADSLLSEVQHRIVDKKADSRIAYAHSEVTEVISLISGRGHTTMTHPGKDGVDIDHFTGPRILAKVITFAKDNHLPCTITADSECKILFLERESFFDWLIFHHEVLRNYLTILSNRGKTLTKYIHAFALESLKERILNYLKEEGCIDNVAHLSRIFGVARPSVSRVLSALKKEGVIERNYEGLILKKQL